MLGELDTEVQKWIKRVRLNGGVVNSRIVMAGAEAIVTKLAKHKLEKYGGHIVITKTLARSILRGMGYVKRKGTKAVKVLPTDFDNIKQKFNEKVNIAVDEYNVPDNLIINRDQTGCQLIPGGDWTMAECGSNQVTICGPDDKRQVTLLLAITKSGVLLPPQLIYQGKTERCLLKIDFPNDWNVRYSETHWSNEETMLGYIDKIVVLYVESVREGLPLSKTGQKAIAIFDVYKAHCGEQLLNKLRDKGLIPLYEPACCTDRLQPLDIAVNHEYKEILKSRFHDWYSKEVIAQLNDQIDVSRVNVDLLTSVLKPIHGKWVMSTDEIMSTTASLITSRFVKAGI